MNNETITTACRVPNCSNEGSYTITKVGEYANVCNVHRLRFKGMGWTDAPASREDHSTLQPAQQNPVSVYKVEQA